MRLNNWKIILAVFLVSCSGSGDRYLDSLGKIPSGSISPCAVHPLDPFDVKSPTGIFRLGEHFLLADHHSEFCIDAISLSEGTKKGIFRKGRGPMEVISSYVSVYGGLPFLYDIASGTCMAIDFPESLRNALPKVDTVFALPQGRDRPASVHPAGGGFISGYPVKRGIWYAFRGFDGECLSHIDAPSYPEMSSMSDNLYWSFVLSTHYCVHPDGTRVCAASVGSPTLSFARIDGTTLEELKRYEYGAPLISGSGQALDGRTKTAFAPPRCDDEYVYLLYSGKPVRGESPSYERDHLVIYDWNGIPLRHLVLSEPVCSFCVDGNRLYGLSTYPENRILEYGLYPSRK